jgi:hypothetical protein
MELEEGDGEEHREEEAGGGEEQEAVADTCEPKFHIILRCELP